ncbi:MAG: patatin-like phospholipase family protein, partial [Planctomycetales bacterium]
MRRLGLALSGGGLRATLYHLGVVRFFRDAGINPKVKQINYVSGGSILGAHLALNWERYCGSPSEFEDAANEVIQFARIDMRNRVVRRFPFAASVNLARRLFRFPPLRRLTRPGLLEQHYERFLFGDTSLFQLPEHPQLHILATNLSEGCLCSFNREGMLFQRREVGRRDRYEKTSASLATVSMAVAASSAVPGFFPPLELTGKDLGCEPGTFPRQAFTDGGVYDNLGLRMFRCMEQMWERDAAKLTREDFHEIEVVSEALASASQLPENTPLRHLAEMIAGPEAGNQESSGTRSAHPWLRRLGNLIRSEELYRDRNLRRTELTDPSARALLHYVYSTDREPELGERVWLNRQIVESALRQVVGKPCLRTSRTEFEGVLVSDAGGLFKISETGRSVGLVGTALRASDILMNRVWNLEHDAFRNASGVLILPMSDVVERFEDDSAPHPAVQRQAARIRTDLDRFSKLEIVALAQHGYCVARKMCRQHAERLDAEIPAGPPWNPLEAERSDPRASQSPIHRLSDEQAAAISARELQHSSTRRVWKTLLDFRDWPSYLWVLLLSVVLLSAPYVIYKVNKHVYQQQMVLSAVADTSPLYRKILTLLEDGPSESSKSMPFEEASALEKPDFSGFEVISDIRIFDLRGWSASKPSGYSHSQLRLRRAKDQPGNDLLRLQRQSADENAMILCEQESLRPTLSRFRQPTGGYLWELALDFSNVPIGSDVELMVEGKLFSEAVGETADEGRFDFTILAETGLVEIWMLMPEGRTYDYFELSGHPVENPDLVKVVVPNAK